MMRAKPGAPAVDAPIARNGRRDWSAQLRGEFTLVAFGDTPVNCRSPARPAQCRSTFIHVHRGTAPTPADDAVLDVDCKLASALAASDGHCLLFRPDSAPRRPMDDTRPTGCGRQTPQHRHGRQRTNMTRNDDRTSSPTRRLLRRAAPHMSRRRTIHALDARLILPMVCRSATMRKARELLAAAAGAARER